MVDDIIDWRRFILSKLLERRDLRVVGVAEDGLGAVLKAEELQPDVILLDVGLPKLSGLAAAGRIRKIAPRSKILFVSHELDLDLALAALRAGGQGYVAKECADRELFDAIDAVVSEKVFVSRKLAGHTFAEITDQQSEERDRTRKQFIAAASPAGGKGGSRHEVQFYADEAAFLDECARLIGDALEGGNAAIFVGTEPHRSGVLRKLRAQGVATRTAVNQGSYIALDAAEMLRTFMVNDLPDPTRFMKAVMHLISTATKAAMGAHPGVVVCGECAALLWAEGKADATIQLEELWKEVAKNYGVAVAMVCGYPLETFRCELGNAMFQRVCEAHSAIHSW